MVRVISVHHFTRQDVVSLDGVGGNGVAHGKDDHIFIGGEHKVDILDLKHDASLKGYFPTVDFVQQLIYCKKRNFICTLESKPARHGGDHSYVRVYLNWDKESTNQPMKARIAGRVTPGSQVSLDILEMVEIPIKRPVEYIACCQATGNIALCSGMSVTIFKCCLKTHDTSKIKFVDFDEMLEIDSAFIVKEVAISEDLIGLVSDTEAHIFQVVINAALLKTTSDEDQQESSTQKNKNMTKNKMRSSSKSPARVSESSMAPFRGREVVKKEGMFANAPLIRKADDYMDYKDLKWIPTLSNSKQKMKNADNIILFPTLVGAGQCGLVTDAGELYGPINASQVSSVRIKLISGQGSSQRVSTGIFEAITLLHRRIDHISDPDLPFSNLILNCLYSNALVADSAMSKNTTHPLLPTAGEKCSKKIGASVFLTTPHNGYLYHITLASNPFENVIMRGGVFSYTAPVDTVVMEPYLLHALTLTGLESYTLRPHPHVIESVLSGYHNIIVPPHWEESVCLVGLRPFLNVLSLTLTESCLALIAANDEEDEKNNTCYSLHLPSAADLYKEMVRVGEGNRTASPATYLHLLLEGHLVLLTAINHRRNREDLEVIPEDEGEDLVSLLKESSALLGDYYANCVSDIEWDQSVEYYRTSLLTPVDIISRLSMECPGLVHVVTSILLQPTTQMLTASQANSVLESLEKIAPQEVSNLILKSTYLKDYKKEKVMGIIKREISNTKQPRPIDVLALALVVQDKGSVEQSWMSQGCA